MKIRKVEAELFYMDRRTDTTKLTVNYRNFSISSKNRTLHTAEELLIVGIIRNTLTYGIWGIGGIAPLILNLGTALK